MKISELRAGTGNVTVTGVIAQKDETREVVTKYGKRLNVANIVLKDDSGQIAMSLWGNDINTVNVGDTIEVSNGYVTEFRGAPQLSTGKFGKISLVTAGSGGEKKGAAAPSEDEAGAADAESDEDM